MKIALIGYGKMGKMIEKIALEKGHEIVSIIAPHLNTKITANSVERADICIDFSTSSCVVNNISQLVSLKKNIVVGTTNWEKDLGRVKALVEENNTGLFYASNFSIGMNLFIKVLQDAAKKIIPTGIYDIAGVEEHHNKKLDAPSGTAKTISKAISESLEGAIEVPFSSIRCGSIPGTHTILFDSPADSITLTHTARNREGFVLGAIAAAEWMKGRAGLFTMEDMLFAGEKVCIV
jgi:4-hydroxy-tetrahydrodipicolinate reductase